MVLIAANEYASVSAKYSNCSTEDCLTGQVFAVEKLVRTKLLLLLLRYLTLRTILLLSLKCIYILNVVCCGKGSNVR